MIGGVTNGIRVRHSLLEGDAQIPSSNINPKVDFKIRINILGSKRTLGATPKDVISLNSYDCMKNNGKERKIIKTTYSNWLQFLI